MLIYVLFTEYWDIGLLNSLQKTREFTSSTLQRIISVYFYAVAEYCKCRSCRLQNVARRPLLWANLFSLM